MLEARIKNSLKKKNDIKAGMSQGKTGASSNLPGIR
jgi:hypothetical protein